MGGRNGALARPRLRASSAPSAPAAPFCSFAMTSLRFNGSLPHCSEGEPDEEFWKNFGHRHQNTQTRIAFLCREPRLVGRGSRGGSATMNKRGQTNATVA